jgi:hypothetical protein
VPPDLSHQGAGAGRRDVEAHFLTRRRFIDPAANDASASTLTRTRGDAFDARLVTAPSSAARPLSTARLTHRNARLTGVEALERDGDA